MILDEQALDPNESSEEDGNTAAHCAAANGKLDAVKFLLERGEGFVPCSKNHNGQTVMHFVAESGAERELIELLVSKGKEKRSVSFEKKKSKSTRNTYRGALFNLQGRILTPKTTKALRHSTLLWLLMPLFALTLYVTLGLTLLYTIRTETQLGN